MSLSALLHVSLLQINLAHHDRFLHARSPTIAANLKFIQAQYLAVQIPYVERQDCICIVLWMGRQHVWLARVHSLQLCLHVTAFNQPTPVLFQARCFPTPLPPAQWKSGIPIPPAVWDSGWKGRLHPLKVPAKQQHRDPWWWIILH